MAQCDPAPALRLWLAHVSQALPPRLPHTERSLASVAYALHALGERPPSLLSLEDILMGCFLHWTATGADLRWGLSALQRIPQGLPVSGPALHEALGWRYGTQPAQVAPLLAPLWDLGPLPVRRGGAATPQAWTSAPLRRVLLIEGWDSEEEGSGGHWVGVTHGGTVRCLS